jgi:hypothetical protein
VVKKKATKKLAANKSSVSLPQKFFIISLFLINVYLIYALVSKLVPFSSGSQNNNQTDSLKRKIQVEVLNGCGVSGIADELTDYLRKKSFDVVNIGNYRSFEIEKSILIDRTGNMFNAIVIADSIGLKKSNVIQQINKDYLLDVTIILGKDYSKIFPLKKRS